VPASAGARHGPDLSATDTRCRRAGQALPGRPCQAGGARQAGPAGAVERAEGISRPSVEPSVGSLLAGSRCVVAAPRRTLAPRRLFARLVAELNRCYASIRSSAGARPPYQSCARIFPSPVEIAPQMAVSGKRGVNNVFFC